MNCSHVNKRLLCALGAFSACALTLTSCTLPKGQAGGYQDQSLLWSTFDLSPNGKTIVFSGNGNGGKDLYLLDLATRQVSQLTNTPDCENYPSFSPNGKTIVYQCGKTAGPNKSCHLFLRSLDGKHIRQLTNTQQTSDDNPHFSPDGEKIVFARSQKFHARVRGDNPWSDTDVFVINRDGSHLYQVTHLNNEGVMRPRFYPDNRHILFENTNAGGSTWPPDVQMHISRADIQGQEPVREAIKFSGMDSSPFFYPGGKQIVFSGNFGGKLDLYRVSLDGHHPVKILSGRSNTGFSSPVVSSDGRSIYCLERYDPNLYTMNANGTGLRQIADSTLFSDPMHWKP